MTRPAALEPEDDETAALSAVPPAGDDDDATPRTARRPGDEPPTGGPRGRGGAGAPCSSRPAPSPSWPPPTASTCWSPPATSRARPSSPASTSGASPPPRPPARSRRSSPRASRPTTPSSPTTCESALSPATAGITLDVDGTVDAADDQPLNPWTRLVTLFSDREVDPVITGEETALDAQIETIAAQVDRAPVDADDRIEGTTPTVADPADGRTLDREGSADGHHRRARRRVATPAPRSSCPVEVATVHVDRAEAERVLDETVTPALSAPVRHRGVGRDVGRGAGRRHRRLPDLHAPGGRRTRGRHRPGRAADGDGRRAEGLRQRRGGRPLRGVRRRGHRRPLGGRRRDRPRPPRRAADDRADPAGAAHAQRGAGPGARRTSPPRRPRPSA